MVNVDNFNKMPEYRKKEYSKEIRALFLANIMSIVSIFGMGYFTYLYKYDGQQNVYLLIIFINVFTLLINMKSINKIIKNIRKIKTLYDL